MAQNYSRTLLVIFFLSVSIIPLIELGHDVLHSFKNPFHNHDGGHRSYAAHTAGDHHGFQKMKFAHQMEDNQHMDNLVWFAYQFSKTVNEFTSIPYRALLKHNTDIVELSYCVYFSPPTRPPLANLFLNSL